MDAKAREKSDEVRKRYEKKLQTMQKELSKLQNAKREHQRLLKTKVNRLKFWKLYRNKVIPSFKLSLTFLVFLATIFLAN